MFGCIFFWQKALPNISVGPGVDRMQMSAVLPVLWKVVGSF